MLPATVNQSVQSICQPTTSVELGGMNMVSGSDIPAFDEKSLFCRCGEGILKRKYFEIKSETNFWKSLHVRAVVREKEANAEIKKLQAQAIEREKEVQIEIEALKAKIHLRELQLYGKKSERTAQSKKGEAEKKTRKKERNNGAIKDMDDKRMRIWLLKKN